MDKELEVYTKGFSPLRGYITYHPHNNYSDELLCALSDLLESSGLTEECENARVALELSAINADGPPYTARIGVMMYFDGGDAFDPAVLFYRSDGYVHIPGKAVQSSLVDDSWCIEKFDRVAFDRVADYVKGVINDPAKWHEFMITAPTDYTEWVDD